MPKTQPQPTNKPQPTRWYCAACGALSSIGDRPAKNPCKCGQ